MSWVNNMGMSTQEASNWIKNNGAVLAKGTIPTWAISEFMHDPDIKWEDMMLKSSKRDSFKAALISINGMDELAVNIQRAGQDQLASSELAFRYVDDVISGKVQIDNSIPEVNGIQYTSASREISQRPGKLKIKVIKKYRRDKINA